MYSYAFDQVQYLEEVKLNEGLEIIEDCSIRWSPKLKSIELSLTVKILEKCGAMGVIALV